MNNNDLDNQLKKMKQEPLSEKEKNVLWSRIESELTKKRWFEKLISSLVAALIPRSRFALALVLILLLLGSSATTVLAANSATPGDFLFPIDIAAEKIQLIISFGDKKDKLRIQFIKERLDEVRIILAFENNSTNHESDSTETTASSTDVSTNTNSETATGTPPTHSPKAKKAIARAIAHLEKAQEIFGERGNVESLAALETVIERFSSLHEKDGEIGKIKEIKIKIKEKKEKIEIAIKTKRKGKSKRNNENIRFTIEIEEDGNDNDDENNTEDNDEKNNGKKVTVCHKNRKTISISKNALETHLAHGDSENTCGDNDDIDEGDEDDDTATSTPDTMAPSAVSDLNSSGATTQTSINLSWTAPGDDVATGTATSYDVRYSTVIITEGNWSSATQATGEPTPSIAGSSENLTISGLIADTTYFFAIKTSDEVPNESVISNVPSLSTTSAPDVIAPILTNIITTVGTTTTGTTTAQITWNTDESATSKVFYNTVSGFNATSTSTDFVFEDTLSTSHLISLTNLNASTTYYFLIESQDEAGNTATSSEHSLLTL